MNQWAYLLKSKSRALIILWGFGPVSGSYKAGATYGGWGLFMPVFLFKRSHTQHQGERVAMCTSVFMIYMSVLLFNVTLRDLSVHLHGGLLLCCPARHFITTPYIKYLGSLVYYCKHIWIKFCTFPWAAIDSFITRENILPEESLLFEHLYFCLCAAAEEWRHSIHLQQSAFCSQQAACLTSDGWN